MSKLIFILVGPSSSKPTIYSDVIDILAKHGYPTISLPFPSAGASSPRVWFAGSVKVICDCLTKIIASEEKKVGLVAQFYTGGFQGS